MLEYGRFCGPLGTARRNDNTWRDNFDVLTKLAVDNHAEDETQNKGIDEEGRMPENESNNGSAQSRPTHDYVQRLIREDVEGQEEKG